MVGGYNIQVWDIRPDAGLVVRGRTRLNKLARWCRVPWAGSGQLTGAETRGCFQELTVEIRFVRGRLFGIPEEDSAALRVLRSPGLLINVGSVQSLRLCPFEYALLIPKPGLQLHCAAQIVRAVGRVRLSASNVSVCVAELVFAKKQLRQGVVDPKQVIVPVERGCDPEGYLEVVDGLLCFASSDICCQGYENIRKLQTGCLYPRRDPSL